MKFYRFISLIVGTSLLLLACNSENENSLTIKGTLVNTDKITTLYPDAVKDGKITLLLYEIPFGGDQPVQLDSQTIPVSQTSFTLKGKTIGNAMFDIAVKDGPMIPLIDEGEDLQVEINFANKERFYKVNGSSASQALRDFIFDYSDRTQPINNALNVLDSLKKFGGNDSVVLVANEQKKCCD